MGEEAAKRTPTGVLQDSQRSPAGLRTDGYLLSRRTAGSRSDGCGNPKGPGVKQPRKCTKKLQH